MSKQAKVMHLPVGLNPDELQEFARNLSAHLMGDAAPRGPETVVIPDEMLRMSWAKRMAFLAAQFRKGRVPDAHIVWLKEQIQTDPKLVATIMQAADIGPVNISDMALTHSQDVAITESAIKMHGLARWADYGFNVFNLTDSLAAMLSLTDATAKYSDIHLPFPAFIVEVPGGFMPVESDYTGPVRILVHEHERRLVYSDDRKTYRESDEPSAEAERWLRVEVFYDSLNTATIINKRISDLSDDMVGESAMKWSTMSDGSRVMESVDEDQMEAAEAAMRAAVNMACSFALWVNATDALEGTAPKRKPQKLRKKKGKSRKPGAWPTTWIMGREIKLDKELREDAKQHVLLPGKRRQGSKLRTQRIVRGHFRRQPHGPRNSLRKIIFIEPYAQGPEEAEAWSKQYNAVKSKP